MTPQQIEALRLAKILENIEGYRVTMTAAHELRRLHEENKKLKEALAEHAMSEVQRLGQEIEQEPVIGKWSLREVYFDEDGEPTMHRSPPQPERHELQAKGEHPAPCARHCEANAFQIVIKNLKAQLAQPEQEPVATDWNAVHEKLALVWYRELSADEGLDEIQDLINTTPPQRTWVGLTDEEIDYFIVHRLTIATKNNLVALIRICEAKFKEKNQ